MTHIATHPELAAVFDEHASPQHCSKRSAHDQLQPLLCFAACAQKQLAEYREKLLAAELADHDHQLDGKLERLHQTLGAIDRDLPAFIDAGRRIALSFTQLDRYFAETRDDLARVAPPRIEDRIALPSAQGGTDA